VEGLNGIAKTDPKLAMEKAGPMSRKGVRTSSLP